MIYLDIFADNLKDLLRFLRRDDPQNRDVFKQVCKWNIVYKDLIPIMEHCQDDRNLVLNAGELYSLYALCAYELPLLLPEKIGGKKKLLCLQVY